MNKDTSKQKAELYAVLGTGRNLHMTLKKQWFDMIASRFKPEEYREVKAYWTKRLLLDKNGKKMNEADADDLAEAIKYAFSDNWKDELLPKEAVIQYDNIVFKNGYSKDAPTLVVEYKGLKIGRGQEQWGADANDFYLKLQLGEILYNSLKDVKPCA